MTKSELAQLEKAVEILERDKRESAAKILAYIVEQYKSKEVALEHKYWSDELAELIKSGELPKRFAGYEASYSREEHGGYTLTLIEIGCGEEIKVEDYMDDKELKEDVKQLVEEGFNIRIYDTNF